MSVKIKVLEPECMPHKKHITDAGIDLKTTKKVSMFPHNIYKIDTGIQVAIPKGFCGIVVPRSGLGTKYGLSLKNTVGIIDADYRGNIFVNIEVDDHYYLKAYERFAQLVIVPVLTSYEIVEELDNTIRGDGGFGSTGDK